MPDIGTMTKEELLRRYHINAQIRTMEMLLGAEFIVPWGMLPGYFLKRTKSGDVFYDADGTPMKTPFGP